MPTLVDRRLQPESSRVYESIGGTYRSTRREDPRIAHAIWSSLGSARSVANIGAGAGSYEPRDRDVLAIEPSATMARQRMDGAAPVVLACAEALPLSNHSFDAALAVNTLHHWKDVRSGVREMRRVARQRVVILHRNPAEGMPLWLTERYFPSLISTSGMERIKAVVVEELPNLRSVPVPLPADCQDGLFSGYWARPEAYLDEHVRRNISNFALADPLVVARGLEALRSDLESGAWDREYGHLRRLPSLDLGHRVLVAELTDA